jgi:putative transposase
MTKREVGVELKDLKALVADDADFLKRLMHAALQEVLEAEMTDALGAAKGERTAERLGYRSGYYGRPLITRVGKLELRVPQDRAGRFSSELFERYQRSEKALVAALAEMYVQGVSTRKVKAITEELCGHAFSASAISAINKKLDAELRRFARRRLEEATPDLVLDARYEKVREEGVIRSQAVQIAIAVNWEGRRQVLAVELANRESRSSWPTARAGRAGQPREPVELANRESRSSWPRESRSSWKEFLSGLRERGLTGVEFVVSDDHEGLKAAIAEVLPEATWQRCYVHFLRNARDHLPRQADDDGLLELRWLYDRRDLDEAERDLAAWLARWQTTHPKLTDWVEETIAETLSFYRLPHQHHKHMRSTNMLERVNEAIRRRTRVVRIFPNPDSCRRLIRALAVETHEGWLEGSRYLNMELLKELKKERLRQLAEAA